jgi:hypothetical protein
MARPLRLSFEGAVYHVTGMGNRRENIPYSDKDKSIFLDKMNGTFDKYSYLLCRIAVSEEDKEMKESVAAAKDADAKKEFAPTKRSDKSIHRARNEPEIQLGSLRGVIGNIRHDGGRPSIDSIATELSGMHTAERVPVLLALQRTHGNQYVQRVVAGIQAKLAVGQTGDIYEQEANRVADAVMRMTEPQVQRRVEKEEEEETEKKKELIMAKEISGKAPEVRDDLHTRLNQSIGSGQPLPKETMTFMEERFSVDFSSVRIHADTEAAKMARDLNAEAFTTGRNIYFGEGIYNPCTSAGKKLLAHELTHVVQQNGRNMTNINRKALTAKSKISFKPTEKSSDPLSSYPFLQKGLNKKEKDKLRKPLEIRTRIRQLQKEMYQFAKKEHIPIHPPYGISRAGVMEKMDEYHERIRLLMIKPPPGDLMLPAKRLCHTDIHLTSSDPDYLRNAKKRLSDRLEKLKVRIFVVDPYAGTDTENRLRIFLGKYEVSQTRGEVHFKDLLKIPEFKVIELEEKQKEETSKQRKGEIRPLLAKLARLGEAAKKEGVGGAKFKKSVDAFRKTLKTRVEAAKADQPLSPDIQLIMKALMLWSKDPGNKWGEGIWDSNDLIMSAPDYATVPASQYKCNAYVAEVIYQAFGIVHRAHKSQEEKGKYFPYRASEWGDPKKTIPHFVVVSKPQMGDIWSIGTHIGIYLGEYAGKGLYTSARDDGSGVFGLEKEQKKHGIQIKYVKSGGVYRRYTK